MEIAAGKTQPDIEALSAITLATRDMVRAVRFYEALGFPLKAGGADTAFSSFALGHSYLNLIAETHGPINWWGRVIIHVSDVDAMYRKTLDAGLAPLFAPRDAPWGERYFHILDPDGHELSFARPLTLQPSCDHEKTEKHMSTEGTESTEERQKQLNQ